jgi:tripartite-type tricarboxylate transporter receptor subunit TctC
VIENRPGGSGNNGPTTMARTAQPDGYTISQLTISAFRAPHMQKVDWNPVTDFTYIIGLAGYTFGVVVRSDSPFKTFRDVLDYAKANPGKLSYGHAGIGSTNHLTGELFKLLAGTPEIVQVPYRGMGPALTDAIGGQVQMAVPGVTGQVLEFHRSGKLRLLAVSSPKRLAAAPEIPTAAEAGLPGLIVTASLGLLAPSGTPAEIIEQIAQATRTALTEPAYRQFLIEGGFEPILDSTPEKFRKSLAADVALWEPVVKSLGLKID